MASAFHFLLLALICIAGIHLAKQQEEACVPGTITNLTLSGNGTLYWEAPDIEPCDISHYLVYVTLADGTVQWDYSVTETYVDVGHLEGCERYVFRVHQVTVENVTGLGWAIYTVTPPPPEANLTVEIRNLTQTNRNVRLEWSLEPEWIRCANQYQVLIYNEDTDYARDVYTGLNSLIINDIVPCTNYLFGVRAVFTLEEEGPVTLVHHIAEDHVTTPPELESVVLFSTRSLFRWQLEPFSENRCPISAIIVDGSPVFNVTQEVLDQPDRRTVTVNVGELSPDNLYFLRATVINSAGSSGPFQMAFQTLELE